MHRILLAWLCLIPMATSLQGQPRNPFALRLGCDTASFPPTISAAELVRRFGRENVTTETIFLGEGESTSGTVLFARNTEKRLEIVWQDSAGQRLPSMIRVQGESGSLWVTSEGITLTTRLRTLERLNGKPFRLFGFGFDGSGMVKTWSGGKLEGSGGGSCRLRMGLDAIARDATDRRLASQVTGDHEFSSAHPAMQTLDPRVNRMYLEYTIIPPSSDVFHPAVTRIVRLCALADTAFR